MAIKHHLVVTE